MTEIEKVRAYLDTFGLGGRVMEFDVSSATVALAAEAIGCEPGRIAKTLSFLVNGQAVFIVAAGDRRIDNPKFKQRFQTKAKMLTAEELEAFSGLQPGGVCPFALPESVTVWLDESLRAWNPLYPAAGTASSAVRLTPEELELASRAAGWVDVTK